MISRPGFASVPALLALGWLLAASGALVFVTQTKMARERSPAGSARVVRDAARSDALQDAERQIGMAERSGGMTQANFDLLSDRLERLMAQAQGMDAERIASLQARLSQIPVGRTAALVVPKERSSVAVLQELPSQGATNVPQTGRTFVPQDDEVGGAAGAVVDSVEKMIEELRAVLVSGGMSADAYEEFAARLAKLKADGADTSGAETLLVTVPVGGRLQTGGCKSNRRPVFTHHLTDVAKIKYVVPPPTLGAGPSLKTHSYIGTDRVRAPLYAPVDMTLVSGSYYESGPYMLEFEVSCEIRLRFIHVTDPIEAVKDMFPETPASGFDSRDQVLKGSVPFKAGELIGYVERGNWDFGVYDTASKNRYEGDPSWGGSWVYTSAVCPFDYYPEAMRSVYAAKFDTKILGGNPSHGESFCRF